MLRDVIFPFSITDGTALRVPNLMNGIDTTESLTGLTYDNIRHHYHPTKSAYVKIWNRRPAFRGVCTSEMNAGLEIYSHYTTVCDNDSNKSIDNREVTITLPIRCEDSLKSVGNKDCYRKFSFALEYFHGHILNSPSIAPTAERRLATSLTMARETRTMVAAATKRR